jgi:ABC-2 type transport system permease protein
MLLIGLALFLFEMIFPLLATSTNIKTEMLKDLKDAPAVAQKILGEGFMDAVLKYGIITFGFIHPFMFTLIILYIFSAFWQVLTAEIASGTVGFTLSRPISRKRIFLNLALVVYCGLAVLVVIALLSTTFGVVIFQAGQLSLKPFISIGWNLYLLMIFIAGYIALFSSFSDSGKKFFTYSSIMLFFFYIQDLLANLWQPLKIISPINPFSYYGPMKILVGSRIGFSQSLTILAISAVMFMVSALIFNRRDLPSG